MEMTLRGNLETRVALLEASVEERKSDIDEVKRKLDKLTWSSLCSAVTLIVYMVLQATGLLHHVG
jgi:hypothetical protein